MNCPWGTLGYISGRSSETPFSLRHVTKLVPVTPHRGDRMTTRIPVSAYQVSQLSFHSEVGVDLFLL